MAKIKNIGTKKIDTLEVNKTYPVKTCGFGKRSGSRGDFMSAYFMIQTGNDINDVVFVNTPNERSAYKAIGVMTGAKVNGNKVTITGLRVVKNGKYLEFEYDIIEYVPETDEINPDEFTPLD